MAGENSNTSALDQQIANLRTLQESYDALATNTAGLPKQGTNPNVTLTTLHNDLQKPASESVSIALTATGATFTGTQVLVHDTSTDTYTYYEVSAGGACSFTVTNGHSYTVSLPALAGFVAPTMYEFVSVNYSRAITYTYSAETRKETLRVVVSNSLSGSQITILNGQTLSVYDTDSVAYSGTVSGSTCDIEIPYGKTYTLTTPAVASYRKTSNAVTFTASQVQRTTTITYQEENYGMFGVDDSGRLYTPEECAALADKTIIKYGYYNDADLAASTRVTDGYGNGFYWKLGAESLGSKQWATSNVDFDTVRLPYYSNLGGWKYAGRYMTDKIIEIGLEVLPEVGNPTPAATACANLSETFGGKSHRGFLLAYDQIYRIATTNRTTFQALYTAVGRTAPTIWSGSWWTSCQDSAIYGVSLRTGGFSGSIKRDSNSVFVAFDL